MKSKLNYFLPEIIIFLVALVVYLPHFIYIQIPFTLNDSYAYLLIAKDFSEGQVPLQGYQYDLPYGFPFFIYLVYALGGNAVSVIAIQTIINILALIFLVHVTKKYINKWAALLLVVFGSAYLSLADILLHNTLLYTESLYTSCIFLIGAQLLMYIKTNQRSSIYWMMLFVLLATYMRSNGIYLFSIPFLLFVRSLLDGNFRAVRKDIIISFLLVLLMSASTNLIVKSFFIPFEPQRIVKMINRISGTNETNQHVKAEEKEHDPYSGTFSSQTYKLLTNISYHNFGNHYYYRAPNQLKVFGTEQHRDNIIQAGYIELYKNSNEQIENTFEFLTKGISFPEYKRSAMLEQLNIDNRPRHPWLYVNHLMHLSKPIFRNVIILIMFYLFWFFSLWKYFTKKPDFKGSNWEIIFFVGSMHMFNIFLLIPTVPRDTSLSRYSLVTELMIYVVIAIGLSDYISRRRNKLNKES